MTLACRLAVLSGARPAEPNSGSSRLLDERLVHRAIPERLEQALLGRTGVQTEAVRVAADERVRAAMSG